MLFLAIYNKTRPKDGTAAIWNVYRSTAGRSQVDVTCYLCQWRSWVEDFKSVMIQSSDRFGLSARSQICLNPVWLGGLREPSEPTRQTGFRQIWLLGETKPVGLIESFRPPPQTRGGFAASMLLGLCPRPHWGSAANPVQEGVWGWEPPAGSGAEPPPKFLRRSHIIKQIFKFTS